MKRDSKNCVIREVSKILAEEPRLEAVALSAHEKKLSIATLGGDENDRLAGRVSQAVSEGEEECGQLNSEGNCAVCGEKPSGQIQGQRVVLKTIHGSTLIEKQTCSTAISFWRWVALKWPKYAPREHKPFAADGPDDDEWKTMALLAGGCLVFGLLGITADFRGHHTLYIVAPDTSMSTPTAELLQAHYPGIPVRAPLPGNASLFDLSKAARILGWTH